MGKNGNSLELVSFDDDKKLVYACEVGFYFYNVSYVNSFCNYQQAYQMTLPARYHAILWKP
jgi:hypothetical protein